MPEPVSRRDLIRRLKRLGFTGPFAGAKHEFMEHRALRLRIPNPHGEEIGRALLSRILREAGITVAAWRATK